MNYAANLVLSVHEDKKLPCVYIENLRLQHAVLVETETGTSDHARAETTPIVCCMLSLNWLLVQVLLLKYYSALIVFFINYKQLYNYYLNKCV